MMNRGLLEYKVTLLLRVEKMHSARGCARETGDVSCLGRLIVAPSGADGLASKPPMYSPWSRRAYGYSTTMGGGSRI